MESISPQFDEDEAPAKVLYAYSSAFVSRGRPHISVEKNESISMLELMSHSQLWQELRGAAQPHTPQTHNSILSNEVRMDSYTFDTLAAS